MSPGRPNRREGQTGAPSNDARIRTIIDKDWERQRTTNRRRTLQGDHTTVEGEPRPSPSITTSSTTDPGRRLMTACATETWRLQEIRAMPDRHTSRGEDPPA